MEGIAQATGKNVLIKTNYNTQDIIKLVLSVTPDIKAQTADFSRQFAPDYEGMRSLWKWVKNNIRYKEDPLFSQWVKEPARLYSDGVGDCKSFTLFILSVLQNLGLDAVIRFSNTQTKGSKRVNHVYPIAILPDGTEVVMDAVHTRFDDEYQPTFYKMDYDMEGLYRLSGIGATAVTDVKKYLADLESVTASISDSVMDNDITKMSAGEFSRWQQAQKLDTQAQYANNVDSIRLTQAAKAIRQGSISGIGSLGKDQAKVERFLAQTSAMTERAFAAPILELPEDAVGSIKDAIKNVAQKVKDAWAKVVNWLFKEALPLAGPFFLFTFIKRKIGPKTEARRLKQLAIMQWIQKAGNFTDITQIEQSIRTGIIKRTGQTPEAILNQAGNNIANIGFALAIISTIAGIIPEIVNVIEKIGSVFKKQKPEVSKLAAPDLKELEEEVKIATKTDQVPVDNTEDVTSLLKKGNKGDDSKMSTGMMVGLGAGALALGYMMTQKR